MLSGLLNNHVLANLAFVLVLFIGLVSYSQMPRERDPTVNFNWVDITIAWPGAAAAEVEKLITEPIEEAIARIRDTKFVLSTSQDNYANLVVRFRDLDQRTFDKRVANLRRDVQAKANAELPQDAEDPVFFEVTSSNAFPTATLVVKGRADDETLRRHALVVKQDLERFKGIERVFSLGLHEPELRIEFFPWILSSLGVTPTALAHTVRAYFRDTAAGTVPIGDEQWMVRLIGTNADPAVLGDYPLATEQGIVPISSIAQVARTRQKPTQGARYDGSPAVVLALSKAADINTLELLDRIDAYIEKQRESMQRAGLELILVDDQTPRTRDALRVMETNAGFGLLFVLLTSWLFLGSRVALFVGLGIPFTLAGTFWLLSEVGFTLNTLVLLGIIIALGMLVDDAVVVVDAIHFRIQRGMEPVRAALAGVREVFKPVTSSVLTTVAAFLPLTLMPGIMGEFMRVVPIIVTVALTVSLIEAFWILPVHLASFPPAAARPSRAQRMRNTINRKLRLHYGRALIYVLRHPVSTLLLIVAFWGAAIGAVAGGAVRVKMFGSDPVPLFYVNLEMPAEVNLQETLKRVEIIETKIRKHMAPGELRAAAGYAGQMFTETAHLRGEHYGQIIVSLNPIREGMRSVDEIIADLREDVLATPGPASITFRTVAGGPPIQKPINIKVRGPDFDRLEAATDALREVMEGMPAITDISDDDSPGRNELRLWLDTDAVKRAGLDPADLARSVRLMVDGEEVATFRDRGEEVVVRVQAKREHLDDVQEILRRTVALPGGGEIALRQVVRVEAGTGRNSIRHYDFRRTITLEADLDKARMDTVEANRRIEQAWEGMRVRFPGVDIDLGGELEDIHESIDSMKKLFWIGLGLVYLILGTQFRSYWQPLLILSVVPVAFTGAVYGLALTGHPLGLSTIYGMIGLAGIAVNSAIVMIVAANERRTEGMSVVHAIVYAARRRLIPIIITSITTIAGLFSLAVGLGGSSLLWQPIASVIVWGLGFSTLLGLFFTPLLYRLVMRG